MYTLSVIFITQNRKFELIRAINSCIEKSIENMEIIIIDNASTDNTEVLLKEILKKTDLPTTYFYSKTNLGVAGGRNKAISLASGKYIFALDDDAIIKTDNFFEIIIERLDKNPKIVAAGVSIFEPSTKKYLHGLRYHKKNDNSELERVLPFNGGAHIIRKNNYLDRNLYPQKLQFGSEELYPCLIAHKEDKVVAYFSDLVVYHLPSSISRYDGKERAFNIILNTFIIRKLCYPKALTLVLMLTFILRLYKNNIWDIYSFKDVFSIYQMRYDKNEKNNMSILNFLKLTKSIKIKKLI